MRKRILKKSEVLHEGYVQGLRKAYGIIRKMLRESEEEDAKIIGMLRGEVANLAKKKRKTVTLEEADRDMAFEAVVHVYETLGGDFDNEEDWDWAFLDNDLKVKVFDACAKVNTALAKEGRWWAE